MRKETIKVGILFLVKVFFLIGVFYVTMTYMFGVIRVPDDGMYPSLCNGDLALFYRTKEVQLNDVIVFEKNNKRYVGRIKALANTEVNITEEGLFLLNGVAQDEKIFYPTFKKLDKTIEYPYVIEEGNVFVLGDFRTNTIDSRDFGMVSKDEILGKVVTFLRRRNI